MIDPLADWMLLEEDMRNELEEQHNEDQYEEDNIE